MTAANFLKCAPLVVLLFVQLKPSTAFTSDSFVGAVYEHPRRGDWTTDTPAEIVQSNLECYKKATKTAKDYDADVIVFPEYGIFPPLNRTMLKDYLEYIPNPKKIKATPCDEADAYSNRPILYTLSCMAKMNNIVVVANMGGFEDCSNKSICPEDGTLHQNANVAFDQNGTLVGRYYKERLYYELGMDLPQETQDPTFSTNFGRFATFICFDMKFEKMSAISRLEDIEAVLFSVMSVNISPFYVSIEFFEGWALGNNATLLAANIHIPGYLAIGSGIYTGREGSIASTLNPDGKAKLVIATVPRRNKHIIPKSNVIVFNENGTADWKDDGKDVPAKCSYRPQTPDKDMFKNFRCKNEKLTNYTLVKLTKANDHLRVCNNGMCCELKYAASNMSESFYLGVFNGTHIPYSRYSWSEENCFVARCDDVNGTACSEFPIISNTLFHRLSLRANFTTKYTYPVLLSSKLRLVPVKYWPYERRGNIASIDMKSTLGIPLKVAGLKGRAFDRDPPYER